MEQHTPPASKKRPTHQSSLGPRFGTPSTARFGSSRDLADNQRGAAAIEYGLICALITLAIVGAVTGLGAKVNGHWTNVSGALNNAS